MKKAISIFQYITISIGIIVIMMFFMPRLLRIKPFIVLSGSMEKEILTGSIAYVNTNVNVEEIKEGDIIAFNTGVKQVTHRVVSINNDRTFTTKGDANNIVDAKKVKFSDYIGKTVFSIPYLGFIVSAIQTKLGYAILILIVGINLVALAFFEDDEKNIDDDKNKSKKNKDKKDDNKKII